MIDYKKILLNFAAAVVSDDNIVAENAVAECRDLLSPEDWTELKRICAGS